MRLLAEEGFVPFDNIIKDYENIVKDYSSLSMMNKLRIKMSVISKNVKPRKKKRLKPKTDRIGRKETTIIDNGEEPLIMMKLPWHQIKLQNDKFQGASNKI